MKFGETPIAGVFIVDIEAHVDERGAFARTFCGDQFVAHGLPAKFVQCNLSTNVHKGTLRGMHWQSEPKPEGKLVRCQRGAIYDVALDLRPRSPTYLRWFGVELNEDNARALCAGRLRAWLPDTPRSLRRVLPDDRSLRRRTGARRTLERPGLRNRMAVG